MNKNNISTKCRLWVVISMVLACCGVMAVVDGIIQPHYAIKSGVKILMFLALPLMYSRVDKDFDIWPLFVANKRGIRTAFGLCLPVFAVILAGYLLLKDVFDFSSVTSSLTSNIGVTKDNFVFVSLYISFVNSLLEEFFFRGIAFLTLGKITSRWFAHVFSAASFALYHIAMMTGWFSFGVFVLLVAGLFAGGLIFNCLNIRSGNIYTSWLVHMFANFAINTIGFMLFDII